MKRKAASDEHVALISNNEDNGPKKLRAAKGKVKMSQNEKNWPDYFQSVSASMTSIQECASHLM